MRASIRAVASGGVLFWFTLLGAPAHAAWDFVPTGAEWLSWPEYCRAQYSWVNAGFEFQYGGTIPEPIVDHWRQVIGAQTFTGMHHWCASIHFLDRARRESEPKLRGFELNRASEDAMFSFDRTDTNSPVYPNMAVTVAQIRDAMGKPDQAQAVLQRSIRAQPKRSEPYVMLAMLDRKQHKLPEARDVLKQADELTGGSSAEVQYNLGLINLELGDSAAARANALAAYGLGYPLPGLKNLLRKKGQWGAQEDNAVAASLSSTAIARSDSPAVGVPSAKADSKIGTKNDTPSPPVAAEP